MPTGPAETSIPAPTRATARNTKKPGVAGNDAYGLRSLNPGESRRIDPDEGVDKATHTARVRAAIQYAQKTAGARFTARQEGDGLRVWRLE